MPGWEYEMFMKELNKIIKEENKKNKEEEDKYKVNEMRRKMERGDYEKTAKDPYKNMPKIQGMPNMSSSPFKMPSLPSSL